MTIEEIKTRRTGVQVVTILSEYQICEHCKDPDAAIASWLKTDMPLAFRPYCVACTPKVVRTFKLGPRDER